MKTVEKAAAELEVGDVVHIGSGDGSEWRTVASVAPHHLYSVILLSVTWQETPGAAPSALAKRDVFEVRAA